MDLIELITITCSCDGQTAQNISKPKSGIFRNCRNLTTCVKMTCIWLAIDNHPDKGGSTETMQCINSEFEKLFAVWKDIPVSPTSDINGYKND